MNVKIKSILIIAAASLLVACGSSGGSTEKDACNELSDAEFSCDALLSDIVDEGVAPAVQSFSAAVDTLHTRTTNYCADISDGSNLGLAESAWTGVMAPLQQLQVMKFGPNSDANTGLLSFYDWESANPYNIDIAIAKSSLFSQVGLSNSDNEKDLVAIEYILFSPGTVQTYADASKENENVKNWRDGKTNQQIQQDRCAYALLVTADLKTRSQSLSSQWQQFDLASQSNSKQVAANQVAEALFYLDKITKDAKIKAVLPQVDDVTSDFKSEKLESQFATQSKEAILNNLLGVKTILTLNDSDDSKTAINDYLNAAGQQVVADRMVAALDDAIANTNSIGADIYTAVNDATNANEASCKSYSSGSLEYVDAASDIESFCALQHSVKEVTDELKGDFTFLTSFTVPASASGDND